MGEMNAMAWILVCGDDQDALWDLTEEMCQRVAGPQGGIGAHSLGNPELPRYCVHPQLAEDAPAAEFRNDDLKDALLGAAIWVAQQLPEDETWRRDQ